MYEEDTMHIYYVAIYYAAIYYSILCGCKSA